MRTPKARQGERLVISRVAVRRWSRILENDRDTSVAGLIEAAGAGDGWAFTELYERYAYRIKAFAASREVDDPDAMANDVMLRVFQNISGFEGSEAAFKSWIFTIARNRMIDVHRHSKRRVTRADREVRDDDQQFVTSAENVALEAIGLAETLALLEVLTPEQREVIALRMIADLGLEQVADVVGRPVTAVKALQRRGLARLQREILRKAVS